MIIKIKIINSLTLEAFDLQLDRIRLFTLPVMADPVVVLETST